MARQLPTTRLGFHYFPDFVHYRQADLNAWLPELIKLRAGWLTLLASTNRAIPEFFLRGVLEAGIQPVLHFQMSLHNPVDEQSLALLFSNYARWGVRFVVLFDRPNTRQAWPAAAWTRANLVERFLDAFIPLAELALQAGLYPVFPPLEPGGDYWDTAFLQTALQGIRRRGHQALIERLVLGAYAWSGNRPLNWGAGGPERWPEARPYQHAMDGQDQRGFHIFDWYLAIAQAVVGRPMPIILVRAGSRIGDHDLTNEPAIDEAEHTRVNLSLAQLASLFSNGQAAVNLEGLEPLSDHVLACNFWLLSAAPLSPFKDQAWYLPDSSRRPVVDHLIELQASNQALKSEIPTPNTIAQPHGFDHYLLLPSYEWGIADWHLDAIRPFVKKYRPTIGFSIADAKRARRVTLVGEYGSFSETISDELIEAGCVVVQIRGSGTELASQLASV